MNSSAATSATSHMEIDDEHAEVDTEDATTSQASMANSHSTLSC